MTLLIVTTIRTHRFDWFSPSFPSDIIRLIDRFSPCYNWSREDNVLDKASELDWPLMITDGCDLSWSGKENEEQSDIASKWFCVFSSDFVDLMSIRRWRMNMHGEVHIDWILLSSHLVPSHPAELDQLPSDICHLLESNDIWVSHFWCEQIWLIPRLTEEKQTTEFRNVYSSNTFMDHPVEIDSRSKWPFRLESKWRDAFCRLHKG